MMCDRALETLLDAEMDELNGKGRTPLAAHLRECAKCRAVARQIALDTHALGRVLGGNLVAPHPVGRRQRFVLRPGGVVGALAVGLVLVTLGVRRDNGRPRLATNLPVAAGDQTLSGVPAPLPVTRPLAPGLVVPPTTRIVRPAAPVASRTPGTPVAARRFAEPVPATAVQFVASKPVAAPAIGDPSELTVTAPQGTRIAILKTGNAAITVVWLY
ncbi:MAG TPA: hypothetical protein VHE78_07560 [Gemmatimonadaceae bacterium]|nr:hypothetical protein [Gemmatimonadaceae bacterium]